MHNKIDIINIFKNIDSEASNMNQLLENWSKINSYSFNIKGLEKQSQEIIKILQSIDCSIIQIPLGKTLNFESTGLAKEKDLGSVLIATKRRESKRSILLLGHMDTVYPEEMNFETIYTIKNRIQGPGVADMKGGLLVAIHALKAFETTSLSSSLGWTLIITPDEEIGSPKSTAIIKEYAKQATAALVYEPSLSDGAFVSQRSGSANFALTIEGKKAHAGRDFHDGRSALLAVGPILQAIDEHNQSQNETTINVGQFTSGDGYNSVPDHALCLINTRAPTDALLDTCENILRKIIKHTDREGVTMQLIPITKRAAFSVMDKKLLQKIQNCCTELGIQFTTKATKGVSDANTTIACGIPTIDSLGVVGGNLHTKDEYALLDSLTMRTKLSLLLFSHIASDSEVL